MTLASRSSLVSCRRLDSILAPDCVNHPVLQKAQVPRKNESVVDENQSATKKAIICTTVIRHGLTKNTLFNVEHNMLNIGLQATNETQSALLLYSASPSPFRKLAEQTKIASGHVEMHDSAAPCVRWFPLFPCI